MSQNPLRCATFLCGLLCSVATVCGEPLQRLEPGNPDRRAILDAARIKAAADLGIADASTLVFRVDRFDNGAPYFCVLGNWAFLSATPGTRAAGQWARLDMPCSGDEKGLDRTSVFLLENENGNWRVQRGGSLCGGDVPWLGWAADAYLNANIPQNLYVCATTP